MGTVKANRLMLLSAGLSLAFALAGCVAPRAGTPPRRTLNLDGTWQIAEGTKDAPSTQFNRTVPVPGLVDLAQPPFIEPGPKVTSRDSITQKDPRREAFWYRRTFTLAGPLSPVATLKVGKALFGTRVILNGRLLGDHAPCFTPGFFDARAAMKIGENELLIRVGADRDAVTTAVPSGFDFEKERYIPGIFDSVELLLSGTPNIVNVQVAPDVSNRQARVRVWLQNTTAGDVTVEVHEAKSGKLAGKTSGRMTPAPEQVLDATVPLANGHLWSPEDPFLYELTVRTSGDEFRMRFGLREFKFDPATGRALLNGQPYPLRGSNITLYRFFEDPDRGDLPWREAWVRLLHRRVKDMHWNSLRYCIGFPPEAWYRIADEEGILIQDEFPIWFGGTGWGAWPKELKTDELAKEYGEWLRERWNHPCVAIWDANNETTTDQTAPAIRQVRGLDLSDRPWDNSYNPLQQPGDCFESHPYHFIDANFKLARLAKESPVPQGNDLRNDGQHAVIINEYGWLWLNRDGTPTTLTKKLYENLLGKNSTTEQRRQLYARYLAAETEFWRCHRKAAGVLHFTALGYSRPDGQTSDHWLDVKDLAWEPEFYRYVRDAFAPVGLMIDAWAETYPAGQAHAFPVIVINDLYADWHGIARCRLLRAGAVVEEQTQACTVLALGDRQLTFAIKIPAEPGAYQLEAALSKPGAELVRSLRDFQVK